jgi:hypothetical protein
MSQKRTEPNTSEQTGDVTVYLREGDYQISSSLNFGPRDSGNNGFNVIWASFPGEKAVLNRDSPDESQTGIKCSRFPAPLARQTRGADRYQHLG